MALRNLIVSITSSPIHPLLFATYPILALLAVNVTEVEIQVSIRALVISLLGIILISFLIRVICGSWRKAALAASFIALWFFSYGHLYQIMRNLPAIGMYLGRHRFLIIIYSVVLVVGLWLIFKRSINIMASTKLMNLIGLVLVAYPIFTIVDHSLNVSTGKEVSQELAVTTLKPHAISGEGDLPDIYYIILDTYTRADALLNDFGFDNSAFLEQLRTMGFYIADCSRSNYNFTQGSLSTALNMVYLPDLGQVLAEFGLDTDDVWVLLKQSLVREQLETLDYKTVAFDTGFEWSRIENADIYLSLSRDSFQLQLIEPFEAMLIKSTLGLILTDLQNRSFVTQTNRLLEGINEINFPYRHFVERQLFILDQLPRIPSFPGPKFVFVHLLIPHVPHIFGPEGEIITDTRYYGGDLDAAINDEFFERGYVNEIRFINSRMLTIVKTLISESGTPPIIIIQSDSGKTKGNWHKILNALYLRGEENPKLYSAISPVNTFRLIFDTYFGTDYGLLPDESFFGNDFINSVPETSPQCSTQ
jgi:hypothetical protein